MYQEHYIRHNEVELFQITRLQQSPTLIIFFHGIGDSHLNYIPFFNEPSLSHYDLCVADLLGHGRSGSAKDYSFKAQVNALFVQLSPLLSSYKNVVFVPHSMGGIHATLLAANAFVGRVNGIFAIETSVTQYGSFIAEKVAEVVAQHASFSAWFETFSDDVYKKMGLNNFILQTYYVGLRLVREEAFLSNALEMHALAGALKTQAFTHSIGKMFASLTIPKVYCLGSLGKQLPSVPFLKENNIDIEYFPTDCHWVGQSCLGDFCNKLVHFIESIVE